jgi:trimethylamine--corrinoid protein Co-methyltransferase
MSHAVNTRAQPRYRLLIGEQIGEIHRATLSILETVGVRVMHQAALDLLRLAGCRIRQGDIALIPNWLVEEAIRNAPRRITIYNRAGQQAMRLEGRNTYFGLGTDLINTIDLNSGQARPSVRQDVANAARVADACDNIDFIASFALPGDVPTNSMYIECVRTMVENSLKPMFFTAAGQEDLAVIFDMAASVAGGEAALAEKPFLIHYAEPTPPLTHSHGALAKLLLCAEKALPVCYTPAALLGGSAPVTVAGGLAQTNAEALSGLVIHQLKRKGAPLISGVGLPPLDMRTSAVCYGAPELRLANSAYADLYHHYGLPMWSTTGSDAHNLDEQAALEHAFGILLAALDGANLIHDVGYLGQGLLGDPASIVMGDEIIAFVKRILGGFEITPETLALETITQVGPGGHYLVEEHTLRHFRTALWDPPHLNRDDPETWAAKGSLRYGERLRQKAASLLAAHHPPPLPEAVRGQLLDIARRAEAALADVHFAA